MRLLNAAKKGHIKRFKISLIASFLLTIIISSNAFAFPDSIIKMFLYNNILGYDDTCDTSSSSSSSSSYQRGDYDGIPTEGLSEDQARRVDELHDMVVAYSIDFGIPWELALAQGIQESSLGLNNATSASEYLHNTKHNYHGINVPSGCDVRSKTCAYAFKTEEDGYYGYFFNLANTGVYRAKGVFKNPTDAYETLRSIAAAGYAGDPNYLSRVGSHLKAIEQRSKEKGWDSSADIAKKYPRYLENAHKNDTGVDLDIAMVNSSNGHPTNDADNPTSFPNKPTSISDSSSSKKPTSTYNWKAGWLQDFEGIIKDSAIDSGLKLDASHNNDYTTRLNGKIAPNKILLHSTEGGLYSGESFLKNGGYGKTANGTTTPAHFSINMKDRKIYQHYPITKPSDAIAGPDEAAGIQIEIMGISNNPSSDVYLYDVNNFTDDDWAYLVDFLYAISGETSIPITTNVNWELAGNNNNANRLSVADFKAYTGVLGHQHAPQNDHTDPGNIWSKISSSKGGGRNLSNSSSNNSYSNNLCNPSTSNSSNVSALNSDAIAKLAVSAAWPFREGENGEVGTCDGEPWQGYKKGNTCKNTPKPKYKELFDSAGIPGSYQDCGHFVASVIVGGGFDQNFTKSGTSNMISYMTGAGNSLWEEIPNNGTNTADNNNLQPGDIMISAQHTQFYVGEIGSPYGYVASASTGSNPTVGAMSNSTNISHDSSGTNYRYFRYRGSVTSSDGKLTSGGMTLSEAQAFIQPYINKANETLNVHSDITFEGAQIHGTSCKYGTLNNCVAFSQWFVNRYTTANIINTTNGDKFVNALINSNQGFINGGNTPRPYAIFSFGSYNRAGWSSHNHTGVVMGIDEANDKIIIAEAACGHGSPDNWKYVSELKLSDWTGQSGLTYAYTDDILNEDFIK